MLAKLLIGEMMSNIFKKLTDANEEARCMEREIKELKKFKCEVLSLLHRFHIDSTHNHTSFKSDRDRWDNICDEVWIFIKLHKENSDE